MGRWLSDATPSSEDPGRDMRPPPLEIFLPRPYASQAAAVWRVARRGIGDRVWATGRR